MTTTARSVRRTPAFWIASGFGSGLAPFAPGTMGTLAALLPWLLLRELPLWSYVIVVLAAFMLGVWAAGQVVTALAEEDPGLIVWDEFVGLWITLALVPPGWGWVVLGVVLFRVFDIWKPWPISRIDRRIKGGFGAMLDDALAGGCALVALQVIAYFV